MENDLDYKYVVQFYILSNIFRIIKSKINWNLKPEELEKIRQQFSSAGGSAVPAVPAAPVDVTSASPPAETSGEAQQIQELRVEVKRLQAEVERLKTDVQDLRSNCNS